MTFDVIAGSKPRINGTKVECKARWILCKIKSCSLVLMEPKWNVKMRKKTAPASGKAVLMEPKWNVKDDEYIRKYFEEHRY